MPIATLRVDNSEDDADETGIGTVETADIEMQLKGVNWGCGMIFDGAVMGQGSTINDAQLFLRLSLQTCSGVGNCHNTIYGVDADNITDGWSTGSKKPSDQTQTSASVSWVETGDVSPNGFPTRQFDVTAIVQEIVDRPAYASDRLALVIQSGAMGKTNQIHIMTWDRPATPSGFRPRLEMNWTDLATGKRVFVTLYL